MSKPESFDIDLIKKEQIEAVSDRYEDDLDELVGALQDAFATANKKEVPEDLIFIALQKTFEEYYDGAYMKIEANYVKRFLRKNFEIGA